MSSDDIFHIFYIVGVAYDCNPRGISMIEDRGINSDRIKTCEKCVSGIKSMKDLIMVASTCPVITSNMNMTIGNTDSCPDFTPKKPKYTMRGPTAIHKFPWEY